jgi:hypothetical protein
MGNAIAHLACADNCNAFNHGFKLSASEKGNARRQGRRQAFR